MSNPQQQRRNPRQQNQPRRIQNQRGPRTYPNQRKKKKNNQRRSQNRSQFNRQIRAPVNLGRQFFLKSNSARNSTGMRSTFKVYVVPRDSGNVAIVFPIHPLFHPGRSTILGSAFTHFELIRAKVTWLPLQGTNQGGLVAITHRRDCKPVSSDNTYTDILTQEDRKSVV